MPLVYLPDVEALFLWGGDALPAALATLDQSGESWSTPLVTPEGLREVPGQKLPLVATASALAVVPTLDLDRLPGSIASWALASKLALDLVARERVVPTVQRRGGRIEARWAAAFAASDDAAKVAALAACLPPAAHAVPVARDGTNAVWTPDALVRAYVDAVVDALVRAETGGPTLPATGTKSSDWIDRWQRALTGRERDFESRGFGERSVTDDVERWSAPALGPRDRLRACFRLELPERDGEAFRLRLLLQSPDDPSLLVPAAEVWNTKGRRLEKLGRAFRDPQESLLEALGRAVRLFPPLAPALGQARPVSLELDPTTA